MKKTLPVIVLIALIVLTALGSPAFAQSTSDVGITGSVGTTGVGAHATFPLSKNVNARLGLGYLGYNYKGSTRDMQYDLDLKANTYDALIDWYPQAGSAFRITGGVAYNGNQISVHARPDAAGRYTVGGNSYDAASAGKVSGKVDFNKFAPYLGVGWGRHLKDEKGWSFSTDIGVLFQGSPKTSLSSSGCTASAAVCNQFANDVARENAELSHELRKFKVYPVLRVGVSYKF